MGRPSLKTPEVIEEICERLSNGEPMARICKDEHMPAFRTVLRWEDEDEEFRRLSLRAREYGTHHIADDCIGIADDEDLKADDKRIRIDTRLRLIGKWNRKVYGEKALIGSDPDNPLPANAPLLDASLLSTSTLKEVLEAHEAAKANAANPS